MCNEKMGVLVLFLLFFCQGLVTSDDLTSSLFQYENPGIVLVGNDFLASSSPYESFDEIPEDDLDRPTDNYNPYPYSYPYSYPYYSSPYNSYGGNYGRNGRVYGNEGSRQRPQGERRP